MADPRWMAEFTIRDGETGATREVRIESPELTHAAVGALKAMAAILDVELAEAARQIEQAFSRAFGDAPPRVPGG